MPLLYLDTTYNYSDPANTNLKYLKKVVDPDGTIHAEWAAPTDDAEFYDATGGWSIPELAPDLSGLTNWDDISWDVINEFGQKRVLKHPEKYSGLVHATKTVPQTEPVSKSIVYEIVDVCHTDWGDDNAFVWMPKTERCYQLTMGPRDPSGTSYKSSGARTALMSGGYLFNSFPSDLMGVWKDINYKYLTEAGSSSFTANGEVTIETAKLVLPAIVEVGLASQTSGHTAEYNKEGTVFQAFVSVRNGSADLIRRDGGYAADWWLRSLNSWAYWNGGYAGFTEYGELTAFQPNSYGVGVVPCFAV